MGSEREPKAGEWWWVSQAPADREPEGALPLKNLFPGGWMGTDDELWGGCLTPIATIPTPGELADLQRAKRSEDEWAAMYVYEVGCGPCDMTDLAREEERFCSRCGTEYESRVLSPNSDPEPDVDEAQEWSDYDPDC